MAGRGEGWSMFICMVASWKLEIVIAPRPILGRIRIHLEQRAPFCLRPHPPLPTYLPSMHYWSYLLEASEKAEAKASELSFVVDWQDGVISPIW